MRCFISINIPENVKKEIKKIQDKLPNFVGKKTELENLHLTLKFLGELDEDKVEEVKDKLREIRYNFFEAEIDSIGVFSEKFIKIVWLHLSECNNLQEIVDEKLKNLFKPENRFMSHLTIARVKNIKNKEKFLEKLNEVKIPKIKFEVNEFCLMKSELDKKGPKYFVVEKYNLI